MSREKALNSKLDEIRQAFADISKKLGGWKFDLKVVYGRRWREKEVPWIDLYESPDGKIACLLLECL